MKQAMTLGAQLVLIDKLMTYHALEVGWRVPVKVACAGDRLLHFLDAYRGIRLYQPLERGEVLLEKRVEMDLNNLDLLVLA